jgi:hypothetical protein
MRVKHMFYKYPPMPPSGASQVLDNERSFE